MQIFIDLFIKLLPLYFIIFLGYIAGKHLGVKRQSIAPLLIYIVVPIVNFKGVFEMEITPLTLTYPLYFFCVACILGLSFYSIGRASFRKKEEAALLSLTSTLANTGYFGIPLLLLLFGHDILGPTVLIIFGLILYEYTLGFYLAAQGKYSPKDAFEKTIRLPVLYAVVAALIANYFYNEHFLQMPTSTFTHIINTIIESLGIMMDKFVGALTFLGMAMIGLGLASIEKIKFNFKFISLSLFSKFIIYPAFYFLFLFFNTKFDLYSTQVTQIIFYMSFVPVGANCITLATQLKLDTDDASIVIILSTVLSLVLIPLVASLH